MSRCRKCKGAGEVPDLTWCGDETCCPRMLECLACAPTAPTAEAIAEALGDALPDVPVYTYTPDLSFNYEHDGPRFREGDLVVVRDYAGREVYRFRVGRSIPSEDYSTERFAITPVEPS